MNTDKTILAVTRANWIHNMKRFYPNFNEKKWAQKSYREAHPQGVLL